MTFIAFTEAIIQMPAPHVWAILFFMMLITLGFGSMFGTLEGVITPLFDAKLVNTKKPYITGTKHHVNTGLLKYIFPGNQIQNEIFLHTPKIKLLCRL